MFYVQGRRVSFLVKEYVPNRFLCDEVYIFQNPSLFGSAFH